MRYSFLCTSQQKKQKHFLTTQQHSISTLINQIVSNYLHNTASVRSTKHKVIGIQQC